MPQSIPVISDRIVPCENVDFQGNPIQRISCAAKEAQKYVVINLISKEECTDELLAQNKNNTCPSNKLILYNTNVVFDRAGTVISM